ncbi:CHAP domain-containing protein [Nocardioides sp. AX2bis]|uniref:CHAP domain-containing protein n=1 Tax=Nocardioides sp. AX2bis TaxID=2653157 RepID=UPI0012EFB8BB|nr:CHAP domain-containing protein [Nocardioides sp. AX2bis]VXB86737.1 CHAP domain-containing protein [Nocardioides sp. AX2bis]
MTPTSSVPRTRPDALLRLLVAGVLALALGASTLLPVAGTAAAKEAVTSSSSSYLCTGYDACARAGYGHAGYKERGGTMYWNMYSGHNCTNYVAYRMVQAGMPNVRPWSGSGNAMFWGTSNSSKTDRTPEVGAVAWFRANRSGVSGSAGHVAYVERVVSPTEIIVSEDSWGGDFHWRRYSVAAGTWPDGFVHFVDSTPALANKTVPKLGGTPQVGASLASGRGTWSNRVDGVSRQWLVDGDAVTGATAKRFTPRPRDFGKTVALQVTARKDGFEPATAVSQRSAAVKRGRFATTAPVVTGTPEVGEVLTMTPGTMTPEPGRTEVSWFADGELVEGATGPRLTVTEELQGARLVAGVDGFGKGYVPARTRSVPTEAVAAPSVEVVEPARVDGTPLLGEELAVDPGTFAPAQAEVRYRWLRDGTRIKGAREATYPVRVRDVGTWLSVEVELVRSGYRRTTQVVEVDRAVRTTPELEVVTSGRARKAVVTLALDAPGVDAPTGEALVTVGGRQVPATVVDGAARVVVEPLRAGERTVRVDFLGSELIEPTSVEVPVTVLPAR